MRARRGRRLDLLRQVAAPNCAYADPDTEIEGHAVISAYKAGFQQRAVGARFVNTAFMTHHLRCMVQWNMACRDGKALSPGVSAGTFNAQGLLTRRVGFTRA